MTPFQTRFSPLIFVLSVSQSPRCELGAASAPEKITEKCRGFRRARRRRELELLHRHTAHLRRLAPLCAQLREARGTRLRSANSRSEISRISGLNAADESAVRDGSRTRQERMPPRQAERRALEQYVRERGQSPPKRKGATGTRPDGLELPQHGSRSGIDCVRAPCPSIHEGKLNSSKQAKTSTTRSWCFRAT
jgi:hypothetical protein